METTTLWIAAFFALLIVAIIVIVSMANHFYNRIEKLEIENNLWDKECSVLSKEFLAALSGMKQRDETIEKLRNKLNDYEKKHSL